MAASGIAQLDPKSQILESLRAVPALVGLPDEQLMWFVENGTMMAVEAGDSVVRAGEPADAMFIIFEGELRFQSSGGEVPSVIGGAGLITGMLPFSRMTNYTGTARATKRLSGLRVAKDLFTNMLNAVPELGPRLVGVMADRVRETARNAQQRDKLLALGKLSAGLAHELNNPASAARHAAANLRESFQRLAEANHSLTELSLTTEDSQRIGEFERKAVGKLRSSIELDSLDRSDCEEAVGAWLAQRGVEDGWQLAPSLVDAGLTLGRLTEIAARFPANLLSPILERVTASLTIERLLQSIEHSTGQITNLVQSVKDYTYMDQALEQEIDVHRGIENTLTMLAHRLGPDLEVIKQYDKALPKICAWASELNQVWTNLIENALEAMNGHGTLSIRTSRELDFVLVEIIDSGPGVPDAIKDRIFDPFFTTKEVGAGTGLGLDTVYRIVQKHHGDVRVRSVPGRTVFQVRLPIETIVRVMEAT